ncbi:MAG: Ig-like domain-containing protein [Myxococcales bacterium]
MLKLSSAVGTILSFALMLAGCGSDQWDRDGRDTALSVLTPRAPAPAEVVRSTKVAFSGRSSAASGSRVTVTAIDGQNRTHTCATTIRNDQTWSCTQQLADGGYTWTAQIGTPSFTSAAIDFVVRTRGLAAPTIDQTPSPTRISSPILTGTSSVVSEDEDDDADDIVSLSVLENGKVICTIRSVTYDQWACALSTKLGEGPHLLTALIKKDGSTSAISNPDLFIVKTKIGTPTMDQVPTPSNVTQPVLSGRGEPGAGLSVTEAGTLLCAATVSAGGSWTCTPPTLKDGTHTVSATQQDAAGNVSGAATVTFVIDTRPVGAPTLDALKSPTAEPRVTFSGTGEPGDQVSVVDTFLHTHCSGRVDTTARWSCSPADPLDDGDYVLTAFQANSVGNKSGPSAPQLLSVRTLNAPLFNAPRSPTREPTPLLTGTLDGAAARSALSVAVLDGERQVCSGAVDATGGWSCHPQDAASLPDGTYLLVARLTDGKGHFSGVSMARVLIVDRTPPKAPLLDQPASPTRKHLPVLSGTAEGASAVTVIDADSGATVCETSANGEGAFNCKPDRGLTAGSYQFSATATDAAGNVSLPAAPVGVTISDVVPPPPTIDSPADGSEVEDSLPLVVGRTAAGTTVQVTLDGAIYEAQVAPDGKWTLLPSAALPFGPHQVSAAAIDADQNVSDPAQSAFSTVASGVARGGCSTGGTSWPLFALALFLALIPKRRARALALLSAVALPLAARAQATSMDVSLFRPASGGDGFASVEGARPPLPGEQRFEVRTWTDYAVHPLTFKSQSGADDVLVRSRTGGWLALQAHLLGPLSVSAQLPVTYSQQGDLSNLPPSSRGPSSLLGGFGDLRLTPRLALLRQEWAGIDLATQLSLEFPTARARTLTDDGRVRAEGLLAIGRRLIESGRGDVDLLGNAFLRLRPPHELLDVKSGNEAGLRAGVGYVPPRSRAWIPRRVYAEMEARTFLRAGFAAGTSPAEWRVGTTICPVRGLAVDLAGGGALTDGVGAPRARFLFGVGWSPSACNENASSYRPFIRPSPLPVQVFSEALSCPPVPTEPKVVQAAYVPVPPPDRDGDGIPDADDSCPDQAGPVANYGCPIGARQMVTVSASKVEILEQVRFDTNKATIKPQSHKLLDQVASVLLSHPDLLLVQVEGHTDDRGSALRNIVLAQSRAEAVAAYLESKGVPAERLRAVGFGQGRPIATNASTVGRATNRRVAFTVLQTRSRVIEAGRPPDS